MKNWSFFSKSAASVEYTFSRGDKYLMGTSPLVATRTSLNITDVFITRKKAKEVKTIRQEIWVEDDWDASVRLATKAYNRIKVEARPASCARSSLFGMKHALLCAAKLSVVALPVAIGVFFANPLAPLIVGACVAAVAVLNGISTGVWHYRTEKNNYGIDLEILQVLKKASQLVR